MFTIVIPKRRGRKEVVYSIVIMHGLDDGTGFVESCKPCYSFGIPSILYFLGVSTSPLDWGVIDPVPELQKILTGSAA